jgi:hypothetical protein
MTMPNGLFLKKKPPLTMLELHVNWRTALGWEPRKHGNNLCRGLTRGKTRYTFLIQMLKLDVQTFEYASLMARHEKLETSTATV